MLKTYVGISSEPKDPHTKHFADTLKPVFLSTSQSKLMLILTGNDNLYYKNFWKVDDEEGLLQVNLLL